MSNGYMVIYGGLLYYPLNFLVCSKFFIRFIKVLSVYITNKVKTLPLYKSSEIYFITNKVKTFSLFHF